jgi:hypothetical protein
MYQKLFMIFGSVLAIAFAFFFMRNWDNWQINSFEECAAAGYPVMESYPRQCRTPDGRHFVEEIEHPIGGERDEWGCLGPAGYIYNENVGACMREWEIIGVQREAASTAVEHIGWEYATTILQVQTAECPGCFMVELEQGEEGRTRRKITLENYTVVSVSLTPEECEDLGGRIETTTGGAGCNETEENLGDVVGFISPAVCCKLSLGE